MRSDKSQGQVLGPALNKEQQCTCACVLSKLVAKKSIKQLHFGRFAYKPFHAKPKKSP